LIFQCLWLVWGSQSGWSPSCPILNSLMFWETLVLWFNRESQWGGIYIAWEGQEDCWSLTDTGHTHPSPPFHVKPSLVPHTGNHTPWKRKAPSSLCTHTHTASLRSVWVSKWQERWVPSELGIGRSLRVPGSPQILDDWLKEWVNEQ
jgi:hypothetical protein